MMFFRKGEKLAPNDNIQLKEEKLNNVNSFRYRPTDIWHGIHTPHQGKNNSLHNSYSGHQESKLALSKNKNELLQYKTVPVLTYCIELIWEHYSAKNLEILERVKAMYMKVLCVSVYTPSRLVYELTRECFLIQDLSTQLLLLSAAAMEQMLLQKRIKRSEI
jgi:hypothetical protein